MHATLTRVARLLHISLSIAVGSKVKAELGYRNDTWLQFNEVASQALTVDSSITSCWANGSSVHGKKIYKRGEITRLSFTYEQFGRNAAWSFLNDLRERGSTKPAK